MASLHASTIDRPPLDRSTRLAVVARFITNTGAEAAFFVGLWGKVAFEFGAGAGALAVMAAQISAASVVGNLVGGLLVDRRDARRVLIATQVAVIPTALLLIATSTLTSLLAVATVSFLLHGIEEAAATSLPQGLATDDAELARVNGALESAGWLAFVLGPAMGGVLTGLFSVDSVFLLDAATSAIAIVVLLGVELRPQATSAVNAGGEDGDPATGFMAETAQGLRVSYRTPVIAGVMMIGSVTWFAFGTFVALEPLYFRDVLGTGPEAIGYVNSVFGVGMFVGSVALTRGALSASFRAALMLSMATGLGAVLYVGTSSMAVVLAGAMAWSIPLGILLPVLRTLAQRAAPAGYTGRVMGAVAMQQNMTSVLPAAFTPWLAASFGVQPVLIGSALLPLVAMPLLWSRLTRHDVASVPVPAQA